MEDGPATFASDTEQIRGALSEARSRIGLNSRLAIVATFIGELRGGRIYKFSDLPMAGITQPLDESVGTDLVARPSVKFRTCLVLRLMATKQ